MVLRSWETGEFLSLEVVLCEWTCHITKLNLVLSQIIVYQSKLFTHLEIMTKHSNPSDTFFVKVLNTGFTEHNVCLGLMTLLLPHLHKLMLQNKNTSQHSTNSKNKTNG